MTHPLARRVLASVGTGFILFACSELVFVNEGPASDLTRVARGDVSTLGSLTELALWYGVFAYIVLSALSLTRGTGLGAIVLIGAFAGLVIEALIVPVAYETPPFSFVWPSLGWHMIVDVLLGWFGLRLAMRRWSGLRLLLVFVAAGIFWGGWSTWWVDVGEPEIAVPVEVFPLFALATYGFWVLGTWVSDRPAAAFTATKWDGFAAVLIGGTLFVITGLTVWPWALALAVLMLLTLVAMRWHSDTRNLLRDLERPPPAMAYVLSLAMPLVATASYLWLIELDISVPTDVLVPFLAVMGASMFVWHLFPSLLARRRN